MAWGEGRRGVHHQDGALFFHPQLTPGGPEGRAGGAVEFAEPRGHHLLQERVEPLAVKGPEGLVAVVVLVFFQALGVDLAQEFGNVHLLGFVVGLEILAHHPAADGPVFIQMALDDPGDHVRGDQFVKAGGPLIAHFHHDVPALDAPPAHQLDIQGSQFVEGPLFQGIDKGLAHGFGLFQGFAGEGEDIDLQQGVLAGDHGVNLLSAGLGMPVWLTGREGEAPWRRRHPSPGPKDADLIRLLRQCG